MPLTPMPSNKLKPFRVVEEPPIVSVYCNGSRLAVGIYDFRFLFAEVMMTSGGEVVQVDRVSVVMSPQHAKRFIESVAAKVREYEDRFGAIPEEIQSEDEEPKANASPESERGVEDPLKVP
jgi:hypothetical protein